MNAVVNYKDPLSIVKKTQNKVVWVCHVMRYTKRAKAVFQGTVRGKRRRGGNRKPLEDNIQDGQVLNSVTLREEQTKERFGAVWFP